jgi:LCP family protein required for cell wall assembly
VREGAWGREGGWRREDGYPRPDDRGYGGGRESRRGGADYGPPEPPPAPGEPGRPSASPARRAALVVAALVSLAVFAATALGWSALKHYDGKVTHIPLRFAPGDDRPRPAGGGTKNILLVGSDAREGTGGKFGQVEGQRADTTILAHLGGDGSTTLVSFPRDLWVQIPAHVDSAGGEHGAQDAKLNAAFAFGGPSLLVRTLEDLTDIRIDHYVQVNFVGFQAMTDAIGGVTVCVKQLPPSLAASGQDNLNDDFSGWHGQVGLNRLDGGQALAFVRQRHGLPEGDIDRIRRQQHFLGAMFREATSTETVLNPFKVTSLLDAATSALTVDQGTSLADLQRLAVAMRGVGGGGVGFETVPASPQTIQGQSALVYDRAELNAFFEKVTGDGPQALSARPVAAIVVAADDAGGTAVPARPVRAHAVVPAAQAPQPAAGEGPASCVY